MPTTQDPSPYSTRQIRLVNILQNRNFAGLALNPGASLYYVTGLHFHLSERPVLVLIAPHKPAMIVLPEFEAAKIASLPYPVEAFTYAEDPTTWEQAFQSAFRAAEFEFGRIGVEPRAMRVLELDFMERAAPQVDFVPAEDVTAELRIIKDEDEIMAMRKAVEIAEKALHDALTQFQLGISERELTSELVLQLLRHGSDPDFPFFPIVASGPNSANPHAHPTDRPIREGDLLIVDWGASSRGYFSDITRTFAIGAVAPEFARIAEIVLEANAAGRAVAKPGATAAEVDGAARSVISDAGYGEYFIHRTGHGLGLESHEHPYIRADNPQRLQPGMTFTIEPGIYLPGSAGVRIEDDVVVTPEGVESLVTVSRQLIRLS